MDISQSEEQINNQVVDLNDPLTHENEEMFQCAEGEPSWAYDKLSWYLSWMWGKTRGHVQP